MTATSTSDLTEAARFIAAPEPLALSLPTSGTALALETHFELRHYHDALYPTLGVQFPDTLRRSVTKRRAEFLAGRHLAQTAIAHLTGHSVDVGIGAQRQPLWPDGLSGSLSHTETYAVCLLVDRPDYLVGIDVERRLASVACAAALRPCARADEMAFLEAGGEDFAARLTLLFSAKETLFKALFPRVGRYFDFDAARLHSLDLAAGRLTLTLTRDLGGSFAVGCKFPIRFRIDAHQVLTYCIESA